MELTEVVLPVFYSKESGEKEHIGTCFVIGTMGKHVIALTAAHVLEEAISRMHAHKPQNAAPLLFDAEHRKAINSKDDLQTVISNRTDNILCNIDKAWGDKNSDVAVLFIDIPADIVYQQLSFLEIDSKGPSQDEDIMVFGYFDGVNAQDNELPDEIKCIAETSLKKVDFGAKINSQKNGVVINTYPDGYVFIKTSCFQVDVPFHSGMSGGPILRKHKNNWVACGVISSDSSDLDDYKYGTGENAIASNLVHCLSMMLPYEPELEYRISVDNKIYVTPIRKLGDFLDVNVIVDISRDKDGYN